MKDRRCSLWLGIEKGGDRTSYKVKTVKGDPAFRVRRVLFKYERGEVVQTYKVTEPYQGPCTCTCPDWARNPRRDCKHIEALRANDLLGGVARPLVPRTARGV